MILQRVTPVTHSVGNCLKRVIVIVASVIVFQNPMSQKNMIGEPSLGLAAGLPLSLDKSATKDCFLLSSVHECKIVLSSCLSAISNHFCRLL